MSETEPTWEWDARPGGRWWGYLVVIPCYLYAFAIAILAMLHGVVAPSSFRRIHWRYAHWWGNGLRLMMRVKVEIEGLEHLKSPGTKVVAFNHSSMLDLMLISSFWEPRATVIYKKEFHRIPVIGRVMRSLDLIPVDRSDRQEARASLEQAAERLRTRETVLWIAPEGTRSRDGLLAPFKLGPFHLAARTHVELVPVVFQGVWQLWPMTSKVPRPGTIKVRFLEPVLTSQWTEDSVRAHADAIRERFAQWVPVRGPDEGSDD